VGASQLIHFTVLFAKRSPEAVIINWHRGVLGALCELKSSKQKQMGPPQFLIHFLSELA